MGLRENRKSFRDFSKDFISVFCFEIGPMLRSFGLIQFWPFFTKFEVLLENFENCESHRKTKFSIFPHKNRFIILKVQISGNC